MTTERAAADHDAAPQLQPPFVCFIPLFGRPVRTLVRRRQHSLPYGQILRLIHATLISLTTLEGVARRSQ